MVLDEAFPDDMPEEVRVLYEEMKKSGGFLSSETFANIVARNRIFLYMRKNGIRRADLYREGLGRKHVNMLFDDPASATLGDYEVLAERIGADISDISMLARNYAR